MINAHVALCADIKKIKVNTGITDAGIANVILF
jgi:hypothetical protein